MKFWLFVITAALLVAQPVDRLDWLRQEVARHDALYFQRAEPEISDYEYDLLKAELRELEAAAAVASTERVGSDLDDRRDVIPHGRPMLSLQKAYSDEDVMKFLEGVQKAGVAEDEWIVVEPKYDGVAINLKIVRGQMVLATTRGDGAVGQDVTEALNAIAEVGYAWTDGNGQSIESIELRGEVFISNAEFASLNTQRADAGDEVFRHPRSVAAGALSLSDWDEIRERNLSLVIHGWGEVVPEAAGPESITRFQAWLAKSGVPGVGLTERVRLTDTEKMGLAVQRVRKAANSFPTDGVVLKVDSVVAQERLGNGATAPRWAIARKFVPPREETTLRRIVWQVGRTGALTPVAEFDPVQLDGTTVARASLHNAGELVRRDLRIGDRIVIEKAGQVVPAIVEVGTGKRGPDSVSYRLPRECPTCGDELEGGEGSVSLSCENDSCRDQVVLRVAHFASRNAVGIRGLGPGTVAKLVAAGLVRDASDLYRLTEAELLNVPGIGEVSARRLKVAIDASRTAPRWRVLVGLGLPGLGPTGAKKVAKRLGRLDDLLTEAARGAALSDLGESVRAQLERALKKPAVKRMVQALDHAGLGRS